MFESLLGKVLTNAGADNRFGRSDIAAYAFDSNPGEFVEYYKYAPEHAPLNLAQPFAGAIAGKTLTTQLSVNDQASIQFQYEELVHNGTDWGDDGKMYITAAGDSTNTDTNGNVVKCGVHELAIPYGWCKVEV